jgi:UDP-N-acetylmuramate--alanine ligase
MLDKKTHIHFMGIGGIGMSGIARVLKERGYCISGCDLAMDQKSIWELQELGCPIAGTHCSTLCLDPSIDILVCTSAVNLNHQEILHAHRRNVTVVPRARMLAELMRSAYSISVAGAHGKTTTTTMIAHMLTHAGLDPSFVIGGFSKNLNAAAHAGTGSFFVAEADESDRSLVQLPATFAVVTNIDREHLDAYKDLNDIVETFKQFLANIPFYGKAILCADDPVIHDMLPSIPHIKTVTYGIDREADITARDITLNSMNSTCTVFKQGAPLGNLEVSVAGKHMLLNSLASIAISQELGIPFDTAAQALNNFQGVERRFCYHGTYQGAAVFDDYAHHPNEISNQLTVARMRATGRLIVVFQPHRFTRTYHLWNEFIQTFLASKIDELIITDIFPASEAPIEHITGERLAQNLTEHNPNFAVKYIPLDDQFDAIIAHLHEQAKSDDLILLLGAGKIFKIPDKLSGLIRSTQS